MLQASRLKVTEGQLATIAGKSAGRKVRCSPQALPVYDSLVGLATSGNYWARLIVQGIRGLTSGRLHMDNVYVKQETSIAYGRGLFYLVLPGIRATLEDCADGTFTLQTLQADLSYLQGQKDQSKPGLWRVRSRGDSLTAELQADGTIERKESRPVVIADRATDTPETVALRAHRDLEKTDNTLRMTVAHSGFDLHHTPGPSIIGLKSARKALSTELDKEIIESAILLANTMYRASSVPGVTWFADWGGSAVLTRAMQILSQEKLAVFDRHRIILNRPTSNSSQAEKLAKTLNMGFIEKRTGITPREIVGNHLHTDLSWKGAGKTGVLGLSAASAVFGVIDPGAGMIAAQVVGLAGAMYFVGSTVASGTKALSPKKYK
jgi:hypothetical protein